MINKLAKVGVQGGNAAFLVFFTVLGGLKASHHFARQAREVRDGFCFRRAEFRRRKRTKQSSEATLEERRIFRGHQAARRDTVLSTHCETSLFEMDDAVWETRDSNKNTRVAKSRNTKAFGDEKDTQLRGAVNEKTY